jgi:uncharacterized protein
VQAELARLRTLDSRRETVLKTIRELDRLTPELEARIQAVDTLTELEDLYLPYKPRRRTRADVARERGLAELADLILEQIHSDLSPVALTQPFLSDDVATPEEAMAGARDIVAEAISDHPEVRGGARQKALRWASLVCEKVAEADDPRGVYRLYHAFSGQVSRLQHHQILALNRGEAEGVLRVRVEIPERDWRESVSRHFRPDPRSPLAGHLEEAIQDAANRLLLPAIERDVRRALTEKAEEHAIGVFADNIRALLKQPPLPGRIVLGIDPGYRTGCKVAVVDPTGRPLNTATIYPHPLQNDWDGALGTLRSLIDAEGVTLIAIGNGTASRETERLVAELIQADAGGEDLHYLIVDEAGASVYSASPLARAELPDLDVSLRGAVSIARRVQDPLAELVKIDPKSMGVGMYQHDVDQGRLSATLDAMIESVVNQVGVDVNTASPALLAHVAGIGPRLAERIVAHRDEHGPFPSRAALLDVSGLGPKTFEQAAGFLRVRDGEVPLDNTGVHPESYPVVERLIEAMRHTGKTWAEKVDWETLPKLVPEYRRRFDDLGELADWLDVGELTLADILDELARPGRDPRADLPAPILREDVLTMDDLSPGLQLKGTVRNVVDFGAFVDIGVKHDGLLHRSQIPRGAVIQVGDVIDVQILRVEPERGRIGLGWRRSD